MVDANLEVAEQCLSAFNRIKMDKDIRYVIFKIENQRVVVVDKVGQLSTSFDSFHQDIPPNEPRFIVFDLEFRNNDGLNLNKIIFIHWCPDTSRVNEKMVYASTKENLKKRFVGIFKEIQASTLEDLQHASLVSALRI